jgi:hypothetical protein
MLARIDTSPHRYHFVVKDIDLVINYLRTDRNTMWHLEHCADGGAEVTFFTEDLINKFKEFLSENDSNPRSSI